MSQRSRASSGSVDPEGSHSHPGTWLVGGLWLVTVMMLAILAWALSQRVGTVFSEAGDKITEEFIQPPQQVSVDVPEFRPDFELASLTRQANPHTVIPERERESMVIHTVEAGDSVFSISKKYDIKPETILWANEDLLQDNPNELSIGQNLKIPAVDGLIYKWKTNDTVEVIARKFKTSPEAILTWPDNHLDLVDTKIPSGTMVMIPGGSRELRSWVVPTFWRANAGANKGIQSQCDTGSGTFGSGTFLWPTSSRLVSGNDYWSGHLGLDIGAPMGAPVYAADGGVVVYSGAINGGYGLMVMIDHGNGFHSLYAHLSSLIARCGQSVSQGQTVAMSGSTGNSTGAHLHFELRYMGAFVNPRDYLR